MALARWICRRYRLSSRTLHVDARRRRHRDLLTSLRGDAVLFRLAPPMRRSTVEVHPELSEAPHLRSSLPHPKNDIGKTQLLADGKSHGPNILNVIFRSKIDVSTILG